MTKCNIVSWNVAGLTAFLKNNPNLLKTISDDCDADIFCLQETKLQDKNASLIQTIKGFESWHKIFSCSSAKLGHSGVLTMCREKPIAASVSLEDAGLDREGRYVLTEFDSFFLINVYVPNSGHGLINLSRRLTLWDTTLQRKIHKLNKIKPVVLTGDLNVAVDDIDIYDPVRHRRSPGFTLEERTSFVKGILSKGFVDTWRYRYPDKQAYTFFSKRTAMRPKNLGWRLDYFVVPKKMLKNIVASEILDMYKDASDHLPILLKCSDE